MPLNYHIAFSLRAPIQLYIWFSLHRGPLRWLNVEARGNIFLPSQETRGVTVSGLMEGLQPIESVVRRKSWIARSKPLRLIPETKPGLFALGSLFVYCLWRFSGTLERNSACAVIHGDISRGYEIKNPLLTKSRQESMLLLLCSEGYLNTSFSDIFFLSK